MARLYSNENLPLRVVQVLQDLGHDVLTSQASGNAGKSIPDAQVLAFAVESQRTLVTMNRRHFIALHLKDSEHYGIVVCTFDPDFDGLAQRIHKALESTSELKGVLIRVNRP